MEKFLQGGKIVENITYIVLGVAFAVLGLINISGNINTIHWYNRTRVSEEDAPKYGKAIGAGTLLMGICFVAGAVVNLVFKLNVQYIFIIVGCVLGLAFILYGQFKYNKGIF